MANVMQKEELEEHGFEGGFLILTVAYSGVMKEWPSTYVSKAGKKYKFEGQWYTPRGNYAGCARYEEW